MRRQTKSQSSVLIFNAAFGGRTYRLGRKMIALTFFLLLLTFASAQEPTAGKTFFRFTSKETSQIPGRPKKAPALRSQRAPDSIPTPPNVIRPASALIETPLPLSAEPVNISEPADSSATSGVYDSEVEWTARTETLDDAWRLALESSRSLQSKDYDYAKAEQDVRAAKGVGLPKLTNASGQHTVSEQYAMVGSIQLPPAMGGIKLPYETDVLDKDFTTSITSLTVPIYMGGRVRGMIEAANSAASAIAAGKQISELDLKYEVVQTYFLVFRVRKLLLVAQAAEKTIAGHEHDAKRLFENGLVTKNVVLSAEVALADARQNVIKAQNAVALSEAAFNRLLWRPLDTPVDITDMPIPDLSGDLETLTELAAARRPELTALAHKSRALAAESKVKRADRLPQVAVIGSHNYLKNSHLNTDSSFSGHLGVVWMPLDGGVSQARQQASNYEALSVAKQYEDAQTAIALQVYQCWLDEAQSRGRVEVARKAVVQADENLRITTSGFQEGIINHTEVLDATAMWTQAQSNLANARYDAILSTYSLRRATGDL